AGQIGRVPALQSAAGERAAGLVAAEKILRGMACAAMPRALDEIGAAIPFRRFAGGGRESSGGEEQLVPQRHAEADVEREGQLVSMDLVVHRLQRVEIGFDG